MSSGIDMYPWDRALHRRGSVAYAGGCTRCHRSGGRRQAVVSVITPDGSTEAVCARHLGYVWDGWGLSVRRRRTHLAVVPFDASRHTPRSAGATGRCSACTRTSRHAEPLWSVTIDGRVEARCRAHLGPLLLRHWEQLAS
jgi:hypothetical protein